ncbi:hypothetical protein PFISCL1PPCAC_23368 [Pristionchus fissidentatus]|uniref:C2H2-type domain-containing protein n=1 Tax=Pristionchus fissidentatus TaxID=1538716 RepID=A0AAV5WIG7_9BILA|nr:hypothetical protein PFISCL1PPCAC_23368 [Pristionchus fissidentatus]
MAKIENHIKGSLILCDECQMIVETPREYYDHLQTAIHAYRADTFDLVPLIVNIHRRNVNEND